MKNNPDRFILLGLLVLALVTRIPFRSQFLYHWDSVNFALSLEHYDVRLHQPHPPGYFLYSMLGKVVNSVVHEANTSLVLISLLGGALGILAIYWLGLRLFNRKVAIIAAYVPQYTASPGFPMRPASLPTLIIRPLFFSIIVGTTACVIARKPM